MQKHKIGFLGSELANVSPDQCLFHVLLAGYEQSVSYGQGTKLGPTAIINASQQLELWDGLSCPGQAGIYTWQAIPCLGETQDVLMQIAKAVKRVLEYKQIPVLLGGEHTVSLGALSALKAVHDFGIVQFDAHADLRDSYEGNRYSHACTMRRAVQDLGIPLVQLGVRALCVEEVAARRQFKVNYFDAATIYTQGLPQQILPENFPQKIYISFDIDALDSSIMPATGTPVPGGLLWYDALKLVKTAITGRQVIGCDLVEFAPLANLHAYDFTAAKLAYELMGLIERNRQAL